MCLFSQILFPLKLQSGYTYISKSNSTGFYANRCSSFSSTCMDTIYRYNYINGGVRNIIHPNCGDHNILKCEWMTFERAHILRRMREIDYCVGENPHERVQYYKYLGTWMDININLHWCEIERDNSKANRCCKIIPHRGHLHAIKQCNGPSNLWLLWYHI